MHSVDVHPSVYAELEYSRSWYEARADHLGVVFLDEVGRAVIAIRESPAIWPFLEERRDIRGYLIHRFPYRMIYRIRGDVIQIIAVMHLRRHPDYWLGRAECWNSK